MMQIIYHIKPIKVHRYTADTMSGVESKEKTCNRPIQHRTHSIL